MRNGSMSEVPPSEQLDRIRRRLTAVEIRVEMLTRGGAFSELTEAVVLLEELIGIERLKELQREPSRVKRKTRKYRIRQADQQVSGGDHGHAEPERAFEIERVGDSDGQQSGDTGKDRTPCVDSNQGIADGVTERVD